MIFFNKNVTRFIKVLVLKGDGNAPATITGNCSLRRDSDGYYWDGSVFVNSYSQFDVNTAGNYNPGDGVYRFPWAPPDYGQYTFAIDLSSPRFYDVVDIEVEQIQFYEAEEPN